MGLFLSDGRMKEKLKSIVLSRSSHEWEYGACVSYWHQIGRVAGRMAAGGRARIVDGLSGPEVKMALSAWERIFIELAALVQGYRMTFLRMAVDPGVSSARAALAEVELAAQVNTLKSKKLAETRLEYKRAFLKAMMKQKTASAAVAKRAASTVENESSARI